MSFPERSPVEGQGGWNTLAPGTGVEIAKLHADGNESTRYAGVVLAGAEHPDWVVIAAQWTRSPVHLDGLDFVPGDSLREYFSNTHWFNVFEVIAPDGKTRGWYANVTYPSWMDERQGVTTVYWHDLIVDLVVLPDGVMTVRDEDELEEANIIGNLLQQIVGSRDALVSLAQSHTFPFEQDRS